LNHAIHNLFIVSSKVYGELVLALDSEGHRRDDDGVSRFAIFKLVNDLMLNQVVPGHFSNSRQLRKIISALDVERG
jgi:hypothetical protein